jgi:RNA polymerase sigma-70 factor, ECF subfamily
VRDRGASAEALATLITDERARQLWQAVARLSSGERTAVILHYRDEMAVRDIARALGVTSGTVKTLLFRARRHLRERMTPIQRETS